MWYSIKSLKLLGLRHAAAAALLLLPVLCFWSLWASSTVSWPPSAPEVCPHRRVSQSWTSRLRPASPLLLPDLGHVQVESLKALQRLDVLRVERHVHHHQPVLWSSVINDPKPSQLPLQVHFKTGVDP